MWIRQQRGYQEPDFAEPARVIEAETAGYELEAALRLLEQVAGLEREVATKFDAGPEVVAAGQLHQEARKLVDEARARFDRRAQRG